MVATAPLRADGEGPFSKVTVKSLVLPLDHNKHSMGDFETCSLETLVHRTE